MHLVRPVAITPTVLTSSNVAEAEVAWDVGHTYAANDLVYRVIDGVHQGFKSAQAANTGHVPEEDPDGTWWEPTGPTNRWAMFDAAVSTQTSNATSIVVELEIPAEERIDTVYLAGLDATSVRIQVVDAISGPAWDETYLLADFSGIGDWYKWTFEPVAFLDELLVVDLPYGAGSTVTITINRPGGTAKCGAVVVGFRAQLGNTEWGVRTEIRDYSKFIENDAGERVLIEGLYRKLASCSVILENRFKDNVERMLAGCRAQVRLYILNESYTTLTILGTAKWAVEMSKGDTRSLCSLQIESIV